MAAAASNGDWPSYFKALNSPALDPLERILIALRLQLIRPLGLHAFYVAFAGQQQIPVEFIGQHLSVGDPSAYLERNGYEPADN
eukprot:CAMPEP_0170508062 /NCGR_PEP_ID=MMETSP0208-20121228/61092_1 /TAXON_ID=197538 /ORGANISM="Strombidium inclinatum, Strain S3" /LENGTH=83 /DNA_ID=CAMNT_0010790713 /DNA_START=357 /DNA_END=608 /DNA_ORIENTATION=+